MKKPLVAAILLVFAVLLATATQAFNEAEANFLPKKKLDPPPIIIQSPKNYTTYYQNDISLNFTIVGISDWWTVVYHLTDLYYDIDGKRIFLPVDSNSNIEQYAANVTGLSKGGHTLTVHANATGVYHTGGPAPRYSLESVQTVTFTVGRELTNTPSPTPLLTPSMTPSTAPTQTPTPTQKPTQTLNPTPSASQQPAQKPQTTENPRFSFEAGIAVAATVVVAILCVGTAVALMRRRKNN